MQCAHADDVMLALVSPDAYWLLSEWRRNTFGDQLAMRQMLKGAQQQVCDAAAFEPALQGAVVSVRTKGLWSTFHKATVRQQQVHDVLALRVVLKGEQDEDQCYHALSALRRMWSPVPGRSKDYVTNPKPNGYQALHETMRLLSGHQMEVQIRTEHMHDEAELGSAAHRKYKGALAALPATVMSGVALSSYDRPAWPLRTRWPLPPMTALKLATRLSM